MGRINFRLPDPLDQEIRELITVSEYTCISELIRDLLRQWVAERRTTVKVMKK